MKRKLIDIKDSTFNTLALDADVSGTNLKQYIETLLDHKARLLEDNSVCKYHFSMSREPSEKELAAIMSSAAESAERKNKQVMENFFANLEKSVADES